MFVILKSRQQFRLLSVGEYSGILRCICPTEYFLATGSHAVPLPITYVALQDVKLRETGLTPTSIYQVCHFYDISRTGNRPDLVCWLVCPALI